MDKTYSKSILTINTDDFITYQMEVTLGSLHYWKTITVLRHRLCLALAYCTDSRWSQTFNDFLSTVFRGLTYKDTTFFKGIATSITTTSTTAATATTSITTIMNLFFKLMYRSFGGLAITRDWLLHECLWHAWNGGTTSVLNIQNS